MTDFQITTISALLSVLFLVLILRNRAGKSRINDFYLGILLILTVAGALFPDDAVSLIYWIRAQF